MDDMNDYQVADTDVSVLSEADNSAAETISETIDLADFADTTSEADMGTGAIEQLSESEIAAVSEQLSERTIHELETLRDSLDLGDGDPDVEQIAGMYKDIKGSEINGEVGEAHHIIPQSLVEQDKRIETTIALEKQDHRDLPTTGGVINRKYESFLPDIPKDNMRHRDEIAALIDNGQYAEAFRNEALEIRKNAFDKGEEGKYDGAIRQALDAEIAYIRENGVPRTK